MYESLKIFCAYLLIGFITPLVFLLYFCGPPAVVAITLQKLLPQNGYVFSALFIGLFITWSYTIIGHISPWLDEKKAARERLAIERSGR